MPANSPITIQGILARLITLFALTSITVSCQSTSTMPATVPAPASPTPVLRLQTTSLPTLKSPTGTPTNVPSLPPTHTPSPGSILTREWIERVTSLVWVAYTPPSADPNKGIEATADAIREDLITLNQAGFTGLVTYGSNGIMGREFPTLAQSLGFEGIIMGIWDPFNEEEITNAQRASDLPAVLGYCVGNEGLFKRYELSDLSQAMQKLRESSGKPVATTEEIDDYGDESLLNLGDWVFPNVHPYFHNQLDPLFAVRWTKGAFDDLTARTDRFVFFKEVGLPTGGDSEGKLSETNQDIYYRELAKTEVRFVYFEAFDQPWKTNLPIEPYWGIFRADRTPKLLGWHLMGKEPTPISETAFYIYQNADSPENHFSPTGFMGDTGDIHIDPAFEEVPGSGQTVIKIVYDAEGKGPNECPYKAPCKWAGVYWQEPPNNWGMDPKWQGKGFNLTGYTRLVFRARAEKASTIEFKVGGINQTYGDSLAYPRSKTAKLTQTWQEFVISLNEADLTHIIGGFVWVTNWERNPEGITFYLDDMRFEK